MDLLQRCSIGLKCDAECHIDRRERRDAGFKELEELSLTDFELLRRRTGLKSLDECNNICLYHERFYLKKYPGYQRNCCDPLGRHSSRLVKTTLREISLQCAKDLAQHSIDLIPGKKICARCFSELTKIKDENISSNTESFDDADGDYAGCSTERVDTALNSLGCSPMKPVRLDRLHSYGKRKIAEASNAIADTIANALQDQSLGASRDDENCGDCEELMTGIKEKIDNAMDRKEKLQLLTLIPDSWSHEYAADYFNVTVHSVRQARELKRTGGVLCQPEKDKRVGICEEVRQKIKSFYEDDEISRLCPGKKDYVRVKDGTGKKIKMQKRLLLGNLKEMYQKFKNENKEKVGFSTFCNLRPKWCVTVGSSGTHSVCVCTAHQNAKLMIATIDHKIYYQDLLSLAVCDIERKECMLNRCSDCPGTVPLKRFLEEKLEERYDEGDTIKFKKWVSTDRSTLESEELDFEEFVEEVVTLLSELKAHHYVAQHQSKYFKDVKNPLGVNECVIVLDFAENYSFIVQDAIQSFHWNNSQATIHPFVIYYKDEESGPLKSMSLACISDHKEHNTVVVYGFLQVMLRHLRDNLPLIAKVVYFSDGCGGQYKNYKNLSNLSFHKDDFGLEAEWHFFATSHGKNACDGVGGTIKRTAAYHSLQRPIDQQILTPRQLFDFCESNIQGIKCFYVCSSDIERNRLFLEKRFKESKRIPGTRSYHSFVPVGKGKFRVSRVSGDSENETQCSVDDKSREIAIESIKVGAYVACVYDRDWFVGIVLDISAEHNEVRVRFMHPKGPSKNFAWPATADCNWIPVWHILKLMSCPGTTSAGRSCRYPKAELDEVDINFRRVLR